MNINKMKAPGFAITAIIIQALALSFSASSFAQANPQANTQTATNEAPASAPLSTKVAASPISGAKSVLMAKLANLHYFSANFSQEVFSDSGELLEQSSGKLAISKPNLAYWHTQLPDELSIVSDGNDVWFYNPWIEQVSVYALSAAIAKTPILLLTSKEQALWEQYNVAQQTVAKEVSSNNTVIQATHTDSFVITAKDSNSQIKSLTLVFDNNDEQLKQFSFLDATGQLSNIKLTNFNSQKIPKASLFNFVVPEGVQLDDQRTLVH